MNRANTIKKLEQAKTVSFLGGVCLLVNAMTGAGLPFTASLFQSSGWVITLIIFFIIAVVSSFSVLFIVEAMQAIPGNKHFQGTVEFATLINFYFGPWEHAIGQFLLYGSVQSQAIQSIVLTGQTLDSILVQLFRKTCGLSFPNNGLTFKWICATSYDPTKGGVVFSTPTLFTLGFLITILCCIPLGMFNLDDNISLQIGSFMITLTIILQWMVSSFATGLDSSRVPPVADNPDLSMLLGTVILNFAFSTIAPSWINLKKRTVNAQTTVWVSNGIATLLYIALGLFPALSYPLSNYQNNLIPTLTDLGVPSLISKITASAFPLILLLPSIPVSCIIANNNLVQAGVPQMVSRGVSFVVPFIVALAVQNTCVLQSFQNWTGVMLVSPANFIIPFVIYLKCLKFRREYNQSRAPAPESNPLRFTHYP